MSVTAKKLSKSGARGSDLDAVVREQIQIIDDKLLRAPRKWGRNVVDHDLPTAITLPGLDKKDAQRIIYATTAELRQAWVHTAASSSRRSTQRCTSPMVDLDVEEVEAMNALIRAKRVQRKDLDEFVKKGLAPAPRAITSARQGRADPAPPMRVANEEEMKPAG